MADLKDAVLRAAQDSKFAEDFMTHPERFQKEYNLTDKQVRDIKAIVHAGELNKISTKFTYIG